MSFKDSKSKRKRQDEEYELDGKKVKKDNKSLDSSSREKRSSRNNESGHTKTERGEKHKDDNKKDDLKEENKENKKEFTRKEEKDEEQNDQIAEVKPNHKRGHSDIAKDEVDNESSTSATIPTEKNSEGQDSKIQADQPKVPTLFGLSPDISSLLQNLAASKQALQQQLEKQKRETQQAILFKKTLQQKLHSQPKESKKETTTTVTKETSSIGTKETPYIGSLRGTKESKEKETKIKGKEEKGSEREKERESHRDRHKDDRERRDRDRDKDRHREDRDKKRDQKRETRKEEPTLSKGKPSSIQQEGFIPPPLILDSKGREVDLQGNILSTKTSKDITTLKANKKYKVKQIMLDLVPLTTEKDKKSIYYDPNLSVPKPDRQRRSLNFLEAGTIVKKSRKNKSKSCQRRRIEGRN